MRHAALIAACVSGVFGLAASSASALAHEAHHATCSETAANALKADIQAMPDGDAKNKAMKEFTRAEEMMAKKDTKACETHMHNAMQAVEE
jgi:hypothetical protein